MPESSAPTDIFRVRLRHAREKREMSQSQLAEKAKLQASAVSHFETGARKPSFDNLRHLADALNVTTDYLLGRSEEMEGTGKTAAMLNRHYSGLSDEYLEMADDFLEMLAKKAKAKQRPGDG